MIIYKITNLINNKIYVGKDIRNNPNYFGSGIAIRNAIKKYGKENFKKEILETCKTEKSLCKREKFWIKKLKSFKPIGYNISEGGNGGNTLLYMSDAKKNKIYKKIRNKFHNHTKYTEGYLNRGKKISESKKGVKFSEKHKKNLSESHKGQIVCDDTRKKLSDSLKGRIPHNKGKKHSVKTIEKIRKSLLGHKCSEETKLKISNANKKEKK